MNKNPNPEPQPSSDIVSLLVREKVLSPTQVDYAKKVQAKLDTPRRLLDVLKALGHISDEKIRETLFRNKTRFRLGSLLLELGYINNKQLAIALNQQKEKKEKTRLGEILVSSNFITEHELAQILSLNLGIPYVEPTVEMVNPSLLEKASVQFFWTHGILPLKSENGSVVIAMCDPLDSEALAAAKSIFGPEVSTSITLKKYIKEVLESRDSFKGEKHKVGPEKSEIVNLVDQLIRDAVEKNVSDIHIEPMRNRIRIRFRRDGALYHHMDLSREIASAVVSRIKIMASADIAERRRHQDGRILMNSIRDGEEIDIRVSFYVTLFGEKVVLRILNKKAELFKVKDLGMGSKMLERFKEDVLELPSGVVIITGPTGAGKTTTLYASINYCNNVDTNIVTAEEPVEYVIEGISQCSIDAKIGLTFEETLRHILRQDPDIIILGEIRDRFSAETAIQAALTGHKVITTFHTEDSIGGLLRLMNMDIEAFLISSTVVCVVAQRLLKKLCVHCKEIYVPSARDLRRLKYQPKDIGGHRFFIGSGCPQCNFTGYNGRMGVFEMLVLNEAVKEAMLKRKTGYEIRRISMESTGLVTLLEDGIVKAAEGLISIPEIIRNLPLLEAPRPLDQIYRLVGTL